MSEKPDVSNANEDLDAQFKADLVALIPHLRAFARTMTGNSTEADDLAQEALAKAWRRRDSFTMGTNMKAWAFMILRNQFYSDMRRAWRSVRLDQEAAERTLLASDDPNAPIELNELRMALAALPTDQREALILVGAGGMSYEEAAEICNCAVGTVKSRVSRARDALRRIMDAGSFKRDGGLASTSMGAVFAELARLSGRSDEEMAA
jgi:RNA polymerase sigma-70 factor, ECF subfamily